MLKNTTHFENYFNNIILYCIALFKLWLISVVPGPEIGVRRFFLTKNFCKRDNSKAHVGAVHKKLKPFACRHCGAKFASRTDQLRHERVHDRSQRVKCPKCDILFSQPYSLKRHLTLGKCRGTPSLQAKKTVPAVVASFSAQESSVSDSESR